MKQAGDTADLFYVSDFNSDISQSDTSSVTNMWSMFTGASSFNQDLSAWDISSIVYMSSMFYESPMAKQRSKWPKGIQQSDHPWIVGIGLVREE